MARASMLELGYLASRVVRQGVTRDLNAVPRRYSTLPARDQPFTARSGW